MAMKIMSFEKDDITALEDSGLLQEFLDDEANYSVVPFKSKLKPSMGWAMPFVTGKRYRIHWAEGLDFERMKVDVSERWESTDDTILINMNFTETREAVNFTYAAG